LISQADPIPNPSVYGPLGPARGAGGTKGLTATYTALAGIAQKVKGPGRATHTSPARSGAGGLHTTTGPGARLPPAAPKVRRQAGGPARSSGHPELGRRQGRHPVAGRGTVGVAGPGRLHKVTRTSKASAESRAAAGRGGGRRTNPPRAVVRAASELTRGPRPTPAPPKGGTPAGSRPKGQSAPVTGLPVAGRLSLPTPRKVGRWAGTGSPEPAPV